MYLFIKRFLKQERAVTAIEYALIACLIAVGIAASLTSVQEAITDAFTVIINKLPTAP